MALSGVGWWVLSNFPNFPLSDHAVHLKILQTLPPPLQCVKIVLLVVVKPKTELYFLASRPIYVKYIKFFFYLNDHNLGFKPTPQSLWWLFWNPPTVSGVQGVTGVYPPPAPVPGTLPNNTVYVPHSAACSVPGYPSPVGTVPGYPPPGTFPTPPAGFGLPSFGVVPQQGGNQFSHHPSPSQMQFTAIPLNKGMRHCFII